MGGGGGDAGVVAAKALCGVVELCAPAREEAIKAKQTVEIRIVRRKLNMCDKTKELN